MFRKRAVEEKIPATALLFTSCTALFFWKQTLVLCGIGGCVTLLYVLIIVEQLTTQDLIIFTAVMLLLCFSYLHEENV